MKYTIKEFAKEIRKKYPNAYDDLSDEELVSLWIKKFPEEREKINFHEKNFEDTKLFKLIDGFFNLVIVTSVILFCIWGTLTFVDVKERKIDLISEFNNKVFGPETFPSKSSLTDEIEQNLILDSIELTPSNTTNNKINIAEENVLNEVKKPLGSVECPVCDGTGKKSCTSCKNGYIYCRACDGKKYLPSGKICINCAGNGILICGNCNGNPSSIVETCWRCNGKKYVETTICPKCKGQILSKEDENYDYYGTGTKCLYCSGDGYIYKIGFNDSE